MKGERGVEEAGEGRGAHGTSLGWTCSASEQ